MELKTLLATVDHTLLTQGATWEEIRAICDDGVKYAAASVCIPASYVRQAREYVGDKLAVCTVIGFPNGYSSTAVKCFEAGDAVDSGADEIDMVINIGWAKDNRWDDLLQEIQAVKNACCGRILKVIVETCLLTEAEKIQLCRIVSDAGADFIKTSTGYGTRGASQEDIRLFRKYLKKPAKIKASGGIRTAADAKARLAKDEDGLYADTAFVAKFQAEGDRTYTVTYEADPYVKEQDDGTEVSVSAGEVETKTNADIQVLSTEGVTGSVALPANGYKFAGWYVRTYVDEQRQVMVPKLEEKWEIVKVPVLDEDGHQKYDDYGEPMYTEENRKVVDEDGNPILQPVLDKDGNPVMEPKKDEANKISARISDPEAFGVLARELEKDFSIVRYESYPFVEMMPAGINKAAGIQILIEHLGIPHAHTYAFGDGPNDLEMLQYVQYGTAMGNSEDSVLKAAKYKTKGIWEDGIYLGLKQYGLI